MKGVALGLCQWKDDTYSTKGRSGYQTMKDSERVLYANATTNPWQGMGGQQKLRNWSADKTTGQGCEKLEWLNDTSRIELCANGAK